jgi:hypothetical protein
MWILILWKWNVIVNIFHAPDTPTFTTNHLTVGTLKLSAALEAYPDR